MKNFKERRKEKQEKRGMLTRFLIALFCSIQLLFVVNVYGQQTVTVNGTVTDSEGQPLPGVTVVEEETSNGTVTNNEGIYEIDVPGNATLVFSFVGMSTQRVAVNSRTQIDIQLEEETIGLEEVVAVGYASQSRRKTTASVSSIDNEELKNIPSVSPTQALQGKLAGVSIPVLSGQPGQSTPIIIRGGTTLRPYGESVSGRDVGSRDPSDPLVIVDGVFRDDFKDVNPDDIESIQVMKDAASTAIYGARGANGVVIIETKSGRGVGKSTFTFRYQHGVDKQIRKHDMMNAREFLEVSRTILSTRGNPPIDKEEALFRGFNAATVYNHDEPGEYGRFKFTATYLDNLIEVEGQEYVDNLLSKGWETMDDPAAPGNTIIFKDSHYQDVVWQTAHTDNYNFSVEGSSDAGYYNVSLGYVDQGGTFIGTNYERFNANANAGYKVNDKLDLTLNMSYYWNDDKYVDNTLVQLTRSIRVPPLNRLYNDDGTPHLGEILSVRNRLHELYYRDWNSNTYEYVTRLEANYEIFSSLRYRPSVSLNTKHFSQLNFEKFFPEASQPRQKTQRQDERKQIMTDHILQYNKAFNDHSLMVLGGFSYIKNNLFRVVGTSVRSATDYISTITGDPQTSIIGGNVVPNINASSLWNEEKSTSLFSQVNYDFDDRYLFTASVRRDGFSNFAPENRFAIFPSLSVGWNLSDEEFWNVNFIDHLKLRTSWGESGLSNLSINDTYGVYGSSRYHNASGITRSNLANPNLLWETTRSVDIGFDLTILNNRLNFVFDVYDKLTKDRLTSYPLPGETGFGTIMYNVGSLRNRGIELEIQANVLSIGDFSWDSNFAFGFNRQMIVELPDNDRDKNRINGGEVYDPKTEQYITVGGYAEGERPGGLWAWKAESIFATDEEAEGAPLDMGTSQGMIGEPKHGGDVNWADLDGDDVIDGHDLVFMGWKVPDKIGGMQNTFRYKGLSVRFVVDYALGHVVNDGATGRAMGGWRAYNEGAPKLAMSDKTWQKQGDTGKKYPAYSWGDGDSGMGNHNRMIGPKTGYSGLGLGGYGVDNSIYYYKGDWLAFRELSASYDLPSSITQMLMFERISLNAGVYNMGYITEYKGLNPEVYKGYDEGNYVRPLQVTFGATFNFH